MLLVLSDLGEMILGTLEIILMLIVAVLLSSLISQWTTKISTPLVQIGLGVIIALFIGDKTNISLDPELFLVLLIAPLLFNEASHMDRLGFWKNRGMILSLALGLVVATVFAVGYSVNALVPSIGLAAAFALGAALGPTDAVAVSSMSKSAKLSEKQKAILGGESLINDATGLVAFQFACAAAVTGQFSLVDAGSEFAIEFFGGILAGIVLGCVLNALMTLIRAQGFENRTFHVLFEVAVPFIAFLIGEGIGVSGVLTVVATGVVFSISRAQVGPAASKMRIVSSSVWDVLSFALNGIVFVMLGIMLPGGMMKELTDGAGWAINWELIGVAFAVTGVVIACRFVWVLLIERIFGSAEEINKGLVKHAAIISFAGAKGTITLSIMMTLPFAIACRSDLIFIASVTILSTLLLANFIIPVLAPAEVETDMKRADDAAKAKMKVLRGVIQRLTDDSEGIEGFKAMAYRTVIDEYTQRVNNLKDEHGYDDGHEIIELRTAALLWQEQYARQLGEQGEFSQRTVTKLCTDCTRKRNRIKKRGKLSWTVHSAFSKMSFRVKAIGKNATPASVAANSQKDEKYKALKRRCLMHAIEELSSRISMDTEYKSENVSQLMNEYQKALIDYRKTAPSVTTFIKGTDMADEIRMQALRYEEELMNEAASDGMIDRKSANAMRRQISAMQLDVANEI